VPVAHTFVGPTEPVYRDIESAIVRYDYDPRRTAQLLEGLGYTRAADGDYRDAAGQPLLLEVRTDGGGGDDEQETAALAVNDAFRRVGISSAPLILTQQQRLDRELNATYPGVRVWRQPNDLWGVDRFASAAAPLPQNRFNGGNRSRYMNAEFDAIVDRYMTTIVERDRVPVLRQIVQHMTDQLNVMGLWYNTEPTPIAHRLKNVIATDVGGATSAWNAHQWDVAP
jgi:peptide/nickel transport system substrate-binding protein